MKKTITITLILVIPLLLLSAKDTKPINDQLKKPLVLSSNNFDGNRIDCDMQNNGMFVSHNVSGRSGLSWPKGNGTQTIYASGAWFGGIVSGEVRVTAGEYNGEFASGPWGADPEDEQYKIYKVNKSDLNLPENNLDFKNWPAELGAPWVDNNNNGIYEPLPEGPDHPEFIGDQVVWMVMNDGEPDSHSIFRTAPLGLEVQRTIFGYDRQGPMGDIMFIKDLVINKGGNTIEDMYIGIWSDPDLGDASDDFVGCDTVLGMGICYNDGDDVNYADYSGGTPAVGYDFFQGPMVPSAGETAFMFGREYPNMKNLQMTSFVKYIGADPVYYDPNNAVEAYNYMKGLLADGSEYPFTGTGGTKFVHPGDPTKDTGLDDNEWIDAELHPSDDRRFLMNAGPITFAPGDSQEVVYGIIHAADGSWDQSYLALKNVDAWAQFAYDVNFNIPAAPKAPTVEITHLENEFILNWGADSEEGIIYGPVLHTGEQSEYKFEGYTVYQVENSDGSGSIERIATYDNINGIESIVDDVYDDKYGRIEAEVQFGTDSGVKRSILINHDYINDKKLITNREYYFIVTAYNYNEKGLPKTFETTKNNIIVVRPQVPNRWEAINDVVYGQYYETEHREGFSDGSVYINIVDPTKITGDEYVITFNDELVVGDSLLQIPNWNVVNLSSGETLLSNQIFVDGIDQLTGEEYGASASPTADGLQFIVNSTELNIKSIGVVANADGPQYPALDGIPYWRYDGWNPTPDHLFPNQANGATWFLNAHPSYGVGGKDTFLNSVIGYTGGAGSVNQGIKNLVPYDYEFRFTNEGGLAYDRWNGLGNISVPFEWWNIGINTPDDISDDYRLIPLILDDDLSGHWGLIKADHETSSGNNDPYTDRIYVHAPTDNTIGEWGYENFFTNALSDGSNVNSWDGGPGENDPGGPMDTWNVFSRTVLMNWNGGDVEDPNWPANINAIEPEIGTTWRIVTTKPNTSADEFFFSTATLVGNTIDYNPNKIKLWPNPYFGYNPEESHLFDRQIHFTHLPETGKCIIRIFDLAGTLVRKIVHDNGTQFEIWDLANDKNVYVASGMYIVHVETEEGEKILKLAVIQPS